VVYRMGFGSTRSEARQLVGHKSILVNGRAVNIPSYMVTEKDVIAVRERSRNQLRIKFALDCASQLGFPEWVDVNMDKKSGVFKRLPERSELPDEINESLIIELYSK